MPPSAPTGQRAAASFSLGEEGNTTVDIVIQPAYQQLEAVKALLLEYTSMLLEQNPAAAGSCLQRQNFEGELANLAEKYGAPQGRLYLIRVDGAPAGCAAMKRLDRYRCELKRLYIRPPFRGQGLARRLVEQLLTDAREEGYEAMLLDTFPFLSQAIRLYRALGFYEIPRYNSFGRTYLHAKRSETGITAEPSGSAVFSPRDPTPAASSAGPGPATPFRRSGPARRTAPG